MIERPKPVHVKLADGTSRWMYEKNPVEIWIAQEAIEKDNLRRQAEHWKSLFAVRSAGDL
jgi:hypothetical protein